MILLFPFYGSSYSFPAARSADRRQTTRTHLRPQPSSQEGVAEADLRNRNLFELASDRQLTLVDLWGSGLVKIGADARITSGSDYKLSRAWAEAIYLHLLKVDGIRYYSRHDNTQLCCGLFDRTSAHLKEQNEGNIVDNNPRLLADILERYDYALL
ncbi:RES family NAD+ phosphorylase [Pleurocapsales cyanobacterium LEGE 10410]|nr:RES family NAD+ phosphorylase [Pleurocapsales cyanobacterium LEGE 10410]